ncbi:MAG: hypothetical protein E5V40_01765 [Mesorhizobium sp.]|nr:MAG: hypothetical protein E5V40_01765 [Mesorhizobium sp.]
MTWHTFNRADLDAFKATWPCHGLPDSLNSLAFEIGSNGDLVDIEAKSRNGRPLDSAAFDGPAMAALAEDAKRLVAEPITPVLFRVHRAPKTHGDDVTAVFPAEPSDMTGRYMTCYAHIGQHGACGWEWYRRTRPATPAEYASLKAELESEPYGYRLKICRRIQPEHRKAFETELRRLHSRQPT